MEDKSLRMSIFWKEDEDTFSWKSERARARSDLKTSIQKMPVECRASVKWGSPTPSDRIIPGLSQDSNLEISMASHNCVLTMTQREKGLLQESIPVRV